MVQVYASFKYDITEEREIKQALAVLKQSGIISGIELPVINQDIERIQEAGLKVSSHNPGLDLTLNLGDPNFLDVFLTQDGQRVIEVARKSDAPTVGFHCGFSAEKVIKMYGCPDVPFPGTLIKNRDLLLQRIAQNLAGLEQRINSGSDQSQRKQIVLETVDYSRNRPIDWPSQRREADEQRGFIEELIKVHGINAGYMFVTEPDFVSSVLDLASKQTRVPEGFLFDIGHVFISADAKTNEGKYKRVEDYIQDMAQAGKGRTYQMHLTVPKGDNKTGYNDSHLPFTKGDKFGERILSIAKDVVIDTPELAVVTFETRTNLGPVEHARAMVKQAEYVLNKLSLPIGK